MLSKPLNNKMKLNAQEKMFVENLKTQEQLCIDKYNFYSKQAKDPGLKDLFKSIGKVEKQHYESLTELGNGKTVKVDAKSSKAENYAPQGHYSSTETPDKKHDCFLCTDSITTEKYVASAYNNDLFHFASQDARHLLNNIQTEEQNHAEMIYLYKSANDMV